MRRDGSKTAVVCLTIVLLLLQGCMSAPVNWDPDDYTVRSGDTLYSIAWRYEIDTDDLARWNQLSSPYIIHPGDRLHTRPPRDAESTDRSASPGEVSSSEVTTSPDQVTVMPGDTLYSLAKKHDMPTWKLAKINNLSHPYLLRPGQVLALTEAASPPAVTKQATRYTASTDAVSWHWPLKGKVVAHFSRWKNDAKGIDIAGSKGASIKAAAAGKVVYSGNGLINYGHLVIIKHSRDYLSAYANNEKLLVNEGDLVKTGQVIATLGDMEGQTPRLHFEIRKKGKPVDPLGYLPGS